MKIDPRGPRFGALVTTIVLALALILGPRVGLWLVAFQLTVFAVGAFAGLKYQPYGLLYRTLIAPHLAPPAEVEDVRPPQFAQLVGFIFAVVAVIGAATGLDLLFYIATGFALIAAFLNAAFDFCLGCEVWTILQRIKGTPAGPRRVPRPGN